MQTTNINLQHFQYQEIVSVPNNNFVSELYCNSASNECPLWCYIFLKSNIHHVDVFFIFGASISNEMVFDLRLCDGSAKQGKIEE